MEIFENCDIIIEDDQHVYVLSQSPVLIRLRSQYKYNLQGQPNLN